jgi:hypothetical protein
MIYSQVDVFGMSKIFDAKNYFLWNGLVYTYSGRGNFLIRNYTSTVKKMTRVSFMDNIYRTVLELLSHQGPETLAQLLEQYSRPDLEQALLRLATQSDENLTLRSRAVRGLSLLGLLNDAVWMVIIPAATTGLFQEWFTTWADPAEKIILSAEHIRAMFDTHRLPKSSSGLGKAIRCFIQRGAGYTSSVFLAGANYPSWEVKYDCVKTIITLDDIDSLRTLAAFSTMSYWKARSRILEYIQLRFEENRLTGDDKHIAGSILEQIITDGKTEPKTPTMSLARKLFACVVVQSPAIENFKDSAVAVLNPQSHAVGTGFLISKRAVVTCVHVIESVPDWRDNPIRLRFSDGAMISASIDPMNWHPAEDIAVLTLENDPPEGIVPLPFGKAVRADGHHFRSYGFPNTEPISGLYAIGDILGITQTEQGSQRLQLRSSELALGHSGGPVWDESARAVVGMVSEVFFPGPSTKNRDTAFAIPTETLAQVIPQLGVLLDINL